MSDGYSVAHKFDLKNTIFRAVLMTCLLENTGL